MNKSLEARQKENEELHAPGKTPVRLRVHAGGANLKEPIKGVTKIFKAGQVFLHPAPKRAQQLIDAGVCEVTTAPTEAELTQVKEETESMVEMLAEEFKEKAKKALASRKARLEALEVGLRKMTPEILKAELAKRELKDVADNTDAQVKAILENELAKIKDGEK